jgi:hypothetical protein
MTEEDLRLREGLFELDEVLTMAERWMCTPLRLTVSPAWLAAIGEPDGFDGPMPTYKGVPVTVAELHEGFRFGLDWQCPITPVAISEIGG